MGIQLIEEELNVPQYDIYKMLEENLGKLQNLESLSLNGLGLESLPSSITQLKNLTLLDLSKNKFNLLPPEIIKLKKLKYLCIGSQAINNVPDNISELESLELLSINNTNELIEKDGLIFFPESTSEINDLNPKEIIKFKSVRRLDLGGVDEKIIHEIDFRNFLLLIELSLFYCHLKYLPDSIFSLKKLKRLDLNKNLLTDFPEKIFALNEISELWLSNNHIQKLPSDVKSHPFNPERIITPYGSIDFFLGLDLRGNPIKNVPSEIINQGFGAIRNYFESIESEATVSFNSAKLMIIGRGGVGKTSLLKKLIQPDFQVGHTLEDTTRGIDITSWNFHLDNHQSVFEARIWDFGGQSHYLAPHQFFLTKRSLYLVVWEAREEDDLNFIDWLNTIKVLSDSSPVIIVMNKSDIRFKSIDEAGLKESFPNIVNFYKVSCTNNMGIDSLRNEIQNSLLQLPHIQDKVPFSWKYIRDGLEIESKTHHYISLDTYYGLCEDKGLDKGKSNYLSNYLHDLGTIIHFNKIAGLSGTIVLNSKWLTDAVYNIIDDNEIAQRYGRFSVSDLRRIWDSTIYPEAIYGLLLQLMEKFSICFSRTEEGEYQVPQLLSPTAPEINWSFDKHIVRFKYQYAFLPTGIISKFMVGNQEKLQGRSLLWRNGVFIVSANTEILVKEDLIQRSISIEARGTIGLRETLAWLRQEIEHLNTMYNNLEVEKRVPCPCERCKTLPKPHDFNVARLIEWLNDGSGRKKTTAECQISGINIPILQLLEGVDIDSFLIERSERSFPADGENIVSKKADTQIIIFVSYSGKDRDQMDLLVNGIEGHLKQRKGYRYSFWNDKAIDLGADWSSEIDGALEKCHAALLMVSANFANSEFINEKELTKFFARKQEENILILPVLIRSYNFHQFEQVSALGFFKTYYKEYGFNHPTERDKFMPFDHLGDSETTTDKQLQDYYTKLAEFIHNSVSKRF